MNKHHETALNFHCRLATETMHPRFARLVRNGSFSVIVTVNSGYE